MIGRFARTIAARHPGIKAAFVRLLRMSPGLDIWLRSMLARTQHCPSPLQIDAAHLPEAATDAYEALCAAIDRRTTR